MEIVLLPGLDGSGAFFAKSEAYFAPYGKVRVLQYPMTGPQTYQALADWVQVCLSLTEPFVLVAESFSGPIAIDLASRKLAGLSGVILAASFVRAPMGQASAILAKLAGLSNLLPIPPATIIRFFLLGKDTANLAPLLRTFLMSCDRNVIIDRAKAALSCDVSEKLRKIEVQMLSLVAKQDRLLTDAAANWSQRDGIDVVQVDAPHFLLQEGNEAQINMALKLFFQKLDTITNKA
jgi:pimeloyl-[acyl-carrier protein] methyl ester esterase